MRYLKKWKKTFEDKYQLNEESLKTILNVEEKTKQEE